MATQNTDHVSSETQLNQSGSHVHRTGNPNTNNQPATSSQVCNNNASQIAQAQPTFTSVVPGNLMADQQSQIADLSCDEDANSIAQSSLGRARASSHALMNYGSGNPHIYDQDSSSESNLLANTTSGQSGVLPKILERLSRYRKRCDISKASAKRHWRRVVHGHTPTHQKIKALEQEAAQCKREHAAKLRERDEQYEALLARYDVAAALHLTEQGQRDVQIRDQQIELQTLRQENQELHDLNAQLNEGHEPFLSEYHAKRTEWLNIIGLQHHKIEKFRSNVPFDALLLCTKIRNDFADAHNGLVPPGMSRICQDMTTASGEYCIELKNILGKYDRLYQKRITVIDRVITQQESRSQFLKGYVEQCASDLRALQAERTESLNTSGAKFTLAFVTHYNDFRQFGIRETMSYSMEFQEIMRQLDLVEYSG